MMDQIGDPKLLAKLQSTSQGMNSTLGALSAFSEPDQHPEEEEQPTLDP